MFYFLEGGIPKYVFYLKFFCKKGFYPSSPTYLFIQSFSCTIRNAHIFMLISCCLFNSSFDQWELLQVGVYSSWKCPIIIFVFVVPYSLIPQNAPDSSWIIPATFFFFFKNRPFSQGILDPFIGP